MKETEYNLVITERGAFAIQSAIRDFIDNTPLEDFSPEEHSCFAVSEMIAIRNKILELFPEYSDIHSKAPEIKVDMSKISQEKEIENTKYQVRKLDVQSILSQEDNNGKK